MSAPSSGAAGGTGAGGAGAGYSINPATTGAVGLSNYLDQTQRNQSSGFRGPVINIATGASKVDASPSADGGGDWLMYAVIGAAIIGAIYVFKQTKKG